MSRRIVRYGFAFITTALAAILLWFPAFNSITGIAQLLLFGSIIATSVFGGFGPGILATVLALAVGRWLPPAPVLDAAEVRVLGVEGVLGAIIGGTLRTARFNASQRLAANLRLEQQILEIGDEERRRIGHDLHDGLGQHLTGISLLTETMSQQIQTGRTPDPAMVETITHLVSQSVQITRDLAKSLSPVTLEQQGFVAAIEELAGTSSALLGINCAGEFEDDPDFKLDRTRSMHLYRIIQEAVNNSVRHGKAKNVRVRVERNGSQLRVDVTDDGSGLSEKTMNNPGLGLRIMQYRARMLGATLAVERVAGSSGTIVTCTCPLDGRTTES